MSRAVRWRVGVSVASLLSGSRRAIINSYISGGSGTFPGTFVGNFSETFLGTFLETFFLLLCSCRSDVLPGQMLVSAVQSGELDLPAYCDIVRERVIRDKVIRCDSFIGSIFYFQLFQIVSLNYFR